MVGLGVTYKADVEDPRETPALKVMELLQHEGADLSYADPFVPGVTLDGHSYKAVELTKEQLQQSDCALLLTAHSAFDYEMVTSHAPVVFDTRNGTKNVKGNRERIVLL